MRVMIVMVRVAWCGDNGIPKVMVMTVIILCVPLGNSGFSGSGCKPANHVAAATAPNAEAS